MNPQKISLLKIFRTPFQRVTTPQHTSSSIRETRASQLLTKQEEVPTSRQLGHVWFRCQCSRSIRTMRNINFLGGNSFRPMTAESHQRLPPHTN